MNPSWVLPIASLSIPCHTALSQPTFEVCWGLQCPTKSTLRKSEGSPWGGGQCPCQGVGSGLCPALCPWPRFRPPPLLAGSLLVAVCLRSGAERPPAAPSSPCPPSSSAQKQPTPPHSPQPTNRSPRGTWPVPFMFPLQGDLPFPLLQTAACQRAPQAWLCPACWPPFQGGVGGTSRGKGQLCHLLRVLNGASARP